MDFENIDPIEKKLWLAMKNRRQMRDAQPDDEMLSRLRRIPKADPSPTLPLKFHLARAFCSVCTAASILLALFLSMTSPREESKEKTQTVPMITEHTHLALAKPLIRSDGSVVLSFPAGFGLKNQTLKIGGEVLGFRLAEVYPSYLKFENQRGEALILCDKNTADRIR